MSTVWKLIAFALLLIPNTAASRDVDLACATADLRDDPAIINAKADEARGRLWILAQDGLYLYQSGPGVIRRFDLPNWQYVIRFACPPSLAVAPDGSVVVTSNVIASLWRVDPALTQASQLDLHVESREAQDFGFSAIEISGSGIVSAHGASDQSRWRIDLETGSAHECSGIAHMLRLADTYAPRGPRD